MYKLATRLDAQMRHQCQRKSGSFQATKPGASRSAKLDRTHLASSSVSNKNKLEGRDGCCFSHVVDVWCGWEGKQSGSWKSRGCDKEVSDEKANAANVSQIFESTQLLQIEVLTFDYFRGRGDA